MAFGSLSLGIQWVGKDGEEVLLSDADPTLIPNAQAGTANIPWGANVKFDLNPNDATGAAIAESEVPGIDTKYPLISWRAKIDGYEGEARLDSQGPNKEGTVDTGDLPLGFGTKPYDDTKGYGLKVKAGSGGNHDKPAASGDVWVEVWAYEITSGIRSNSVRYRVS